MWLKSFNCKAHNAYFDDLFLCTPKLFDRFKRESKVKTLEEQKVGPHSLTRSTLGVEGRAGALKWD